MIVSAYQPYFFPFPSFFAKALGSDCFVLLDTVQFPRGTTWLTRNRLKNDNGTLWMTIPVWKKGLGLQKINQVKICHQGRWAKKHMASLKTAYARSPFFEEHLAFLEEVFSTGYERLVDMNLKIILHIMRHLSIGTRVLLLSDLDIDAREPDLSVEICKKLGATSFLAQSSIKKHLREKSFKEHGINLVFFSTVPLIYPQLWGDFIPNLSAFDLLFNCGPRSSAILSRPPGPLIKGHRPISRVL